MREVSSVRKRMRPENFTDSVCGETFSESIGTPCQNNCAIYDSHYNLCAAKASNHHLVTETDAVVRRANVCVRHEEKTMPIGKMSRSKPAKRALDAGIRITP